MAFEVVFVDGKHHGHHFARGLLGLLVVFFEGALDVAELALHAQRCGDELHGGHQLVGRNILEDLNILVLVGRLFGLGAGRGAGLAFGAGDADCTGE